MAPGAPKATPLCVASTGTFEDKFRVAGRVGDHLFWEKGTRLWESALEILQPIPYI